MTPRTDGSTRGRRPALIRPPALNTGEGRTASRLELFFDLAYVVAVAELSKALTDDPTWHGIGVFAGLFTTIWFSWVGFTLYANRFDTDDVVFRLVKLAATLAMAGCAAAAVDADGSGAVAFAASFLLGRALLVGLYLRAWWHVREARATTVVYLTATSVTCPIWATSLAVDGDARWWLWAAAIAIDAATPALASVRTDAAVLHIEHLPERFALLVILVLGEGVSGLAMAVHEAQWGTRSVALGVAAFVVVGALWWSYFDAGAPQGEEELEELEDAAEHSGAAQGGQHLEPEAAPPRSWAVAVRARLLEDVFIYGHLPLTLGVAVTAVGLEGLVHHPDEAPGAARWLVGGGLLLYCVGLASIVGGTAGSWSRTGRWLAVTCVLVASLVLWTTPTGVVIGAVVVTVTSAVAGSVAARAPRPLP